MAEMLPPPPGFELTPTTPIAPPAPPPGFEMLPPPPGFEIIGAQEQPGAIEDAAKAGGSALIREVPSMVAYPVDAVRAVGGGVQWLAEKIARKVYGDEQVDRVKAERAKNPSLADQAINALPGSQDIRNIVREYAPGADYDPQTRSGRYAKTVGEFLPSAALGPGGMARKLVQYGVGAGVASEAAGEATQGTKYEPYARAAGAIAGGAAPSLIRAMLPGSRSAETAIGQAMRGVTQEQVNAAEQLMTRAQAQGVPLTWPEALQQVTEGAAPAMSTLQRVAESDQRGRRLLGVMMGERPQRVSAAVQDFLGDIAPAPANVSGVGPMLARNAEEHISSVRRGINDETRPMYDMARGDRVDAATMAGLVRLPGWDDALQQVRNDPQLNRHVAGLPDNNVLVVDAVKQRLREGAENASQPLNPNASQTRAAGMGADADTLQRAATDASAPLTRALEEQQRLRAERLTPLQEGQMGAIARSDTTRGATEALLPSEPLPGLAAETGRTTAALAARDPQLTAQAIRTRLEDQFNRSAKDLQRGPNQYGGANFRKAAYGNEALRENLQAAVRELPNGQQLSQGLDELMEVLQATGRREQPGSMTAFNEALKAELKQGSLVGEVVTDTARLRPLGALRDRYETWTLGRNMEDLARLLSDPESRNLLMRLADTPNRGPTRTQLQAALAARIIAESDEDESANEKRRRLIGSMTKK